MASARKPSPREISALERLLGLIQRSGCVRPEALGRAWLELALRSVVRALFRKHAMELPAGARLFELGARDAELEAKLAGDEASEIFLGVTAALLDAAWLREVEFAHAPGAAFEWLSSFELDVASGTPRLVPSRRRRAHGMFYTPAAIGREVAERALSALERSERALSALERSERELRICDPACGAGAFLIEAARAAIELAVARGALPDEPESRFSARERMVQACLFGVDLDPLAIAVAELSLAAFIGRTSRARYPNPNLCSGDALTGPGFSSRASLARDPLALDWRAAFPACREVGFELVIGNPPWVAYAGRATQPLDPRKRGFFAQHFRAFKGYPTLHALFAERALELAPRGVIALLVPSPLADLDGYRPLRATRARSHVACEPLLEFGEDAFEGVTQPCFALVAAPRDRAASQATTAPGALTSVERDADHALLAAGRPLRLAERTSIASDARALEAPSAVTKLFTDEPLPAELFGELGFQSTRIVSERLLLRADAPRAPFTYPLLEGREVRAFEVGAPRLFLHPDPAILKQARCKVRALEDYQRVRFVVRQTAKAPIAALHSGLPFRNTLLAGFAVPGFSPEFVVGLLNSALYRALHLARQRDARQNVFPQVKVSHLRALPRPPRTASHLFDGVSELARRVARQRDDRGLWNALDQAVFDLFGFGPDERRDVIAFLRERAPELLSA